MACVTRPRRARARRSALTHRRTFFMLSLHRPVESAHLLPDERRYRRPESRSITVNHAVCGEDSPLSMTIRPLKRQVPKAFRSSGSRRRDRAQRTHRSRCRPLQTPLVRLARRPAATGRSRRPRKRPRKPCTRPGARQGSARPPLPSSATPAGLRRDPVRAARRRARSRRRACSPASRSSPQGSRPHRARSAPAGRLCCIRHSVCSARGNPPRPAPRAGVARLRRACAIR